MRDSSSPSVYVIVLNWNNGPDTMVCLESLACVPEPDYRTVVVDNGSTDGSEERIRQAHPHVTLLQTGSNLGYAGGNNVGIRYALERGADLICILNNDTIVHPEFLSRLIAALEEHPECGIATPLIAEASRPERVWAIGGAPSTGTGVVTRLHAGDSATVWRARPPFEVGVAVGTAMLVRREVFERVGLLDEGFFLYYEEIDWCLFARDRGYGILGVPGACVWHRVSAALGPGSPILDYYMLRNHLRLVARHRSGWRRWRAAARIIGRDLATIVAYSVKPWRGRRLPHRNARLLALRDAALGRWGRMGDDVMAVCQGRPLL